MVSNKCSTVKRAGRRQNLALLIWLKTCPCWYRPLNTPFQAEGDKVLFKWFDAIPKKWRRPITVRGEKGTSLSSAERERGQTPVCGTLSVSSPASHPEIPSSTVQTLMFLSWPMVIHVRVLSYFSTLNIVSSYLLKPGPTSFYLKYQPCVWFTVWIHS